MNTLDLVYQDLLQTIIDNGVEKKDRTGTGTKSIFGYQIRHDMSKGFPLLTTKKMYWKGIVTELLWFLRGDTNIKYLVDNDCHIWDGDAYKAYLKKYEKDKLHGVIYENDETQNRPFSKEEFINWIKNNDKFSELYGELGPVYGKQWRSWHWRSEPVLPEEKYMIYTTEGKPVTWSEEKYIDQIANLINDLKTNPDSRRLMVSAWNVAELDQMTLPPCHYGFQVYTRELSDDEQRARCHPITPNAWDDLKEFAKLTGNSIEDAATAANIPTRAISLMWNQRSVDTFLGLPFNIASYGLLLEIIAKMVNMVPDELIGNLGDVHLYENHLTQAREQLVREPYALSKLEINDQYWVDNCSLDTHILSMLIEDFKINDYQSHPTIKAPLSN